MRAGSSAGARNGRAGNTQNEVGIGREREPDGALARRADPVEVAVPVQHVRDDLEVDVGRPVTVAGRRADRADALSARDRRPGRKRPDRVGRQVAVERVEAGSVLGRVLEDHRRPVVEPHGVVPDGVNASRKWREDRGAGLHEDVDGDVHGAALGVLAGGAGEGIAAVDEAGLVVAADPDVRAPLAHSREEAGRHRRGREGLLRGPELRACNREVEDEGLREVRGDDGRHLLPVPGEPRLDRGRPGAGDLPAGVPERVMRESGMHVAHARERLPGRRLADQEVRVVGRGGAAVRGQADAGAEAERGERPEDLDLRRRKGPGRVVAGGDPLGGREGVRLAEDRVGDRDRELADGPGLDHVAEIEDPGDRALGRGGRGRADEQVVVVAVVVDHTAGKLRQPRPNGRFEETPRSRRRARGGPDRRSLPRGGR